MASQFFSACAISILFLCAAASSPCGQAPAQDEKSQSPSPPSSKVAASRQAAPARQPSPEEQLQQAINNSGNDRAALVDALWLRRDNKGVLMARFAVTYLVALTEEGWRITSAVNTEEGTSTGKRNNKA